MRKNLLGFIAVAIPIGLYTAGVVLAAGSSGVSTQQIRTGAPIAIASGAAAEGTAVGVARSDHQHGSLTSLTVSTSVGNDGGGLKHIRGVAGCATAAAVGAACTTVVTWSTAFADANYTARCNGRLITSGVPVNGGLTAQVAASVTFQTVATTAVAAQFTNIDCIALHD